MPSRYIHLDVARRALSTLSSNQGAQSVFDNGGPDANRVTSIARSHPAYVALGAIGPDFFFPYPDFKQPLGLGIWVFMSALDAYYTQMDDLVWMPEEDAGFDELDANTADTDDLATEGRAREQRRLKALALTLTTEASLGFLTVLLPELLGLSIGNVAQGYDEQGFAWSDMLHYRRTYEFAARMWRRATEAKNERFQAFALGWMTHLATDVTGHAFVNQKCGGPWRLHWQRHQLIESHMDGLVYGDQHGGQPIYNAIGCSAIHMWIGFNPGASAAADDSYRDFFSPQPVRPYNPGSSAMAALDRKKAWDKEADGPELPIDLAKFLADVLQEVFGPEAVAGKGQWAQHPTIVRDYDPASDGFPTVEGLRENYRRLYRWISHQTTDFYHFLPPVTPPMQPGVVWMPPPTKPPGFPAPPSLPNFNDSGPGMDDESLAQRAGQVVEFGLSLWTRLRYVQQVMQWAEAVVNAWNPVNAVDNWLKRWFEYWFIDLPLYNAMLGVHWCFSLYGVTLPLPHEVNPGLTTLGVGVDLWKGIHADLNDPRGGLDRPGPPAGDSEPTGLHADKPIDPSYPRDATTDHASRVGKRPQCPGDGPEGQAASEYLTPWQFPLMRGNPPQLVPTEMPSTMPGPYTTGENAKVLMGGSPGDPVARAEFEAAQSEGRTIVVGESLLPQGKHLGDPIDYTAYVVARLTRDNAGTITNFNLDADRGYGSLCWDWIRSPQLMATPAAWTGNLPGTHLFQHRIQPKPGQPSDPRAYHAPMQPGFGWCKDDLAVDNCQVDAAGQPLAQPIMHDTTALPNDPGQKPVLVRYLDLEPK